MRYRFDLRILRFGTFLTLAVGMAAAHAAPDAAEGCPRPGTLTHTLKDLTSPGPTVPLQPERRGWLYRVDQQKRLWVTGYGHLSRGVSEIYFETPYPVEHEAQIGMAAQELAKTPLSSLPEDKIGYAIHFASPEKRTQVYQIVDLSRLPRASAEGFVTEAQHNLFETALDLTIEGYRARLKLPEADLKRLREISESAKDRSILLAQTDEGYLRLERPVNQVIYLQEGKTVEAQGKKFRLPLGRSLPERFNVQGNLIAVISHSEREPLPLESYTGFQVPRKPGETLLEAGRYYVSQDGAENAGPRLIRFLTAIALSKEDISRVVIEADEAHYRLFRKYGFKPIHERINSLGKKDYILEVSPQEFFARAEKLSPTTPPVNESLLSAIQEENWPAVEWDQGLERKGVPFWKTITVIGASSRMSIAESKIRDIVLTGAPQKLAQPEIERALLGQSHWTKAFGEEQAGSAARWLSRQLTESMPTGTIKDIRNRIQELLESRYGKKPVEDLYPIIPAMRELRAFWEKLAAVRARPDLSQARKRKVLEDMIYQHHRTTLYVNGDAGVTELLDLLLSNEARHRTVEDLVEEVAKRQAWIRAKKHGYKDRLRIPRE